MKKYIKIISITLAALVLNSCSEDLMDTINENKNNPTDVASSYILTDIMISTAFSIVGSDAAFYSSVYVEHGVGVYGQLYNAEIRTGEPTSSTTYNNTWNSIYSNLLNLKAVIEKCSEGGSEEGNYHALGVAQILTAYNLAILTDLFGDVPWTEALQPGVVFTPKVDSQESIYSEIFTLLENAITNLAQESEYPSLGAQDVIYDGDVDLWTKFANGLLARYTMRLSHVTPDYDAVISYANKSFTSVDEQAQFVYDEASSFSPFYQFFEDRDYIGASQSLHEKLVARDDPRDTIYFAEYPDSGELIFAPNGSPEQKQKFYGVSAISIASAPTYLMSYHEVEFLKAEAYARQTEMDDATEALQNAIAAAFQKPNIDLSSDDAEEYYTNEVVPRLTSNTATLREIIVQKYLAFYEEEAIEAYNDYRRLKAMGESDFIELKNPLNTNQFPLRFTYGAEDVTTNVNVRDVYGDGTYVYSEPVWWAGGSR